VTGAPKSRGMTETRTVTTLRSRRAEIFSSICEKRIGQARADLAHVTACIAIFEARPSAKRPTDTVHLRPSCSKSTSSAPRRRSSGKVAAIAELFGVLRIVRGEHEPRSPASLDPGAVCRPSLSQGEIGNHRRTRHSGCGLTDHSSGLS
jgi:hypothetical protein